MFVPGNGDRGRGDGDASFAFLLHVVHRGVAVVDVADRANETGVEQHPFDGRRFARVDVRDDAEISNSFRIGDLRCRLKHLQTRRRAAAAAATQNESQREKSHLKKF